MDIGDAIRKRKSIRGFTSTAVPREVLVDIVETAVRAPSALNTQPWEIIVLAGEPLERLRAASEQALVAGIDPTPDFGGGRPIAGVYRERSRELGFALYGLLGIARDDWGKRDTWTRTGFRLFDAPAAIILALDESLDPVIAASDVGGLAQTICLAALAHGLGTCINIQGVMYPQLIREVTGLPSTKKMFVCIAVGYPDGEHPANALESLREPLENNTYWYGF